VTNHCFNDDSKVLVIRTGQSDITSSTKKLVYPTAMPQVDPADLRELCCVSCQQWMTCSRSALENRTGKVTRQS